MTVIPAFGRVGLKSLPDIRLCQPSESYRPSHYPWAAEAQMLQKQMNWIPRTVPLGNDVKSYNELSGPERAVVDNILRVFTQADLDVTENYMTMYQPIFRNYEISSMLRSFAAMEDTHVTAYALLIDTLGKPDTYFKEFLEIDEMRAKHDLMRGYRMDNVNDVAISLALAGAFGEGLSLFSQFAILLNFTRFNKLTGMGQIVTYSVRDETLHVNGLIRLFHQFVDEAQLNKATLRAAIIEGAEKVVMLEDAFIDRTFEHGQIHGLTPEAMKEYIRYTADYRLRQLGFEAHYGQTVHPLPWLETTMNAPELANFFEQRSTEYSTGATEGDWSDAFSSLDRMVAKEQLQKVA